MGLPLWLAVLLHFWSAFGFAYVVGHSHISLPFRDLLSRVAAARWLLILIECPACLGFWLGAVPAYFGHSLIPGLGAAALVALVVGLATCASNLLLARFAGLSEPHS